MLKILFHRKSHVVRSLEILGVIGSFFFLKGRWAVNDLQTGLYLFLVIGYLFVRACDWISWYPREPRGIGIEVHFKKALVPTSYILAVTSIFALLDIPYLSTGVILLADLLMLVVAPVNGIVIYFHLKDKDPLPINYFSLNKYLNNTPHPPSYSKRGAAGGVTDPCTDTSR